MKNELYTLKQIKMPFLKQVKNGEPVFENKTIMVPAEPVREETK